MEQKKCSRCRQTIWLGTEDTNRAALPYLIDPAPLTAAGELDAISGGLRTWTMHWSGAVYLRSARVIRQRPAGITPRQNVHADHACEKGEQ